MIDALLPYVDVNPGKPHDAVVVWLHGLGDSGNGFAPIVPELKLPESMAVRFVFPHAPVRPVTINNGMQMRAWYDIKSMQLDQRADVQGVLESADAVEALIKHEIAQGIPAERVVLAGFSQGGVIALHLGPRFESKLAGIMALSTYMSQPDALPTQGANLETPIYMAHGLYDEVVPHAFGKAACQQLHNNGYNCDWHDYPMQHNVCMEQLQDISLWLQKVLAK